MHLWPRQLQAEVIFFPPTTTLLDFHRYPASVGIGDKTTPKMKNAAVANRVDNGMSAAGPVGAHREGFDCDLSAFTLTAH
jgi:hypothetical protein